MKMFFSTLMLALIACHTTPPATVDLAQAEQQVAALADRFHATMVAKDAAAQIELLAENGLYCGTDPGELWSRQTLAEYLHKGFADTTWQIAPYTIADRKIQLAADGATAIVVDQFLLKELSSTITTRFTGHAIRNPDGWHFDFFSLSLVPLNEHLQAVSEAVKRPSK